MDIGHSVARFDIASDVQEQGVEAGGELMAGLTAHARYSRAERGADRLAQIQGRADWRLDDVSLVSAEARSVQETRGTDHADGTLGALRYERRLGDALDLYTVGQLTLADDDGSYAANDALTLGGRYRLRDRASVGGEATAGSRGNAAQISGDVRLSATHDLYGSFSYATLDVAASGPFAISPQDGWTVGQRWRPTSAIGLFNETQSLRTFEGSGIGETYGLDFRPSAGWSLGATLSTGRLERADGGRIDRHAVSGTVGKISATTEWQGRLERRQDSGLERRTQWVITNRLHHRVDESLRLAARINYADTQDALNSQAGATFLEANLGFAYRPWDSSRIGFFGRYTHLHDLATLAQIERDDRDQRSNIVSLESVYRLDDRWEMAGRVARRQGEARAGRGEGAWFGTATTFLAGQIRYAMLTEWYALGEFRTLSDDDGTIQHGWVAAIDRDISKNLRLGVGYNFTRFSDDLTRIDHDQKGFFLNVVGRY